MKTPIFDFARDYVKSGSTRAHMPGHKGVSRLGVEHLDITEITGADSLYETCGIIKESENNASDLFGAHTLYSTEGSSLSIRAMLAAVARYSKETGGSQTILAARNVHKSFVYGAALVGLDVEWIYGDSYLACEVDVDLLASRMDEIKPIAVYLTSPDYLGNKADVRAIADLCHERGVLLLVDSAHGAYLKFLESSEYPTDLGADMCATSAHKTLPVLTGGGYLHLSMNAPRGLLDYLRSSMELFGSTSPSYLILESLDLCNAELASGYAERIADYAGKIESIKAKLNTGGYSIVSREPLKITISAKKYGYFGTELASILSDAGVCAEFSDPDYLVLMLTPDIDDGSLIKITDALLSIPRRAAICEDPPVPSRLERAMSTRDALFSPSETVPVSSSVGRILATASVGCPPAVPLAISGEVIDEATAAAFKYYGIDAVSVIKEKTDC